MAAGSAACGIRSSPSTISQPTSLVAATSSIARAIPIKPQRCRNEQPEVMKLRRERKEAKRQRIALQRYVALRMTEDIETSVKIVTRKAQRLRRAANKE